MFASNAFAILGLRALYFLLAGLQDKLIYLNKGLGVILVYVGIKMLASFWEFHINIALSLSFIVLVLAITVVLSLRASARIEAAAALEGAAAAEAPAGEDAATVDDPDDVGDPTTGGT